MTPLVARDALAPVVRVGADQRPEAAHVAAEVGTVVAVLDRASGHRVLGLLTPRQIAGRPGPRTFADLVFELPVSVPPETPLEAVARRLEETELHALAVVGEGVFAGAITPASVQRALLQRERLLLRASSRHDEQAVENAKRLATGSLRLEGLHDAALGLLGLLGERLLERESLQRAIEVLARLLDARYGAIGLVAPDGALEQFVWTGIGPEEADRIGARPTGKGLLGVIIRQNETLVLDDIAADPRSGGFPPEHPPMRRLLAVPISHDRRVFGRVYLCDKTSGEPFTEDDVRLASCLADSICAMILNSRAIEAQSRLETQLRTSQKLEAIGRLAAGVAHDFNNVLTVIGFGAAALARRPDVPPDPARVSDILDAVDRAAALAKQLLAFGREQPLHLANVDLNDVVADAVRMLSRLLPDRVTVETQLAPSPPRVRADATQLVQVLLNLAINARDAMPRGGTLVIATRTAAAGTDPGSPARRAAQIVVRDTGTGIEPDHLPHIFEPFFTTKDEGGGSGLGLATAYGIVTQSGGRIDVTSEVGSGTTFVIAFPEAAAGDPAAAASRDHAVPNVRGRETVLLVEDSEPVRRATADALRSAGHLVLVAADGAEALDLAARHAGTVDALVTDLDLPTLDGRELAAALRSSIPRAKVLFVSGGAFAEPGPNEDFLAKPYSPATLLAKLRRLLEAP